MPALSPQDGTAEAPQRRGLGSTPKGWAAQAAPGSLRHGPQARSSGTVMHNNTARSPSLTLPCVQLLSFPRRFAPDSMACELTQGNPAVATSEAPIQDSRGPQCHQRSKPFLVLTGSSWPSAVPSLAAVSRTGVSRPRQCRPAPVGSRRPLVKGRSSCPVHGPNKHRIMTEMQGIEPSWPVFALTLASRSLPGSTAGTPPCFGAANRQHPQWWECSRE